MIKLIIIILVSVALAVINIFIDSKIRKKEKTNDD